MSTVDEANCEYYDQCLGFQDDSTVTALAIGVLIVDIFLFIASMWHRSSNLEHLLFITSRYYLYFYFVNLVNFSVIIISVTFFNYTVTYSQLSVGVTLQLTALSTMLINVIGCKYYRAYLCMKKLKLRVLLFLGIASIFIFTIAGSLLLYLTIFDEREGAKISFDWFLFFELLVTVVHTSIASFASKLAQVQWILLIIFTVLYVESFFNTNYTPFNLFLIYWHPILLCCISVAAVFGLSPFVKLRYIGVGIFSCFIAMFDLVTDINVIYVWISKRHYIWAMWQTLFILTGVIFSGIYVKDYYGFVKIEDDQENGHKAMHSDADIGHTSVLSTSTVTGQTNTNMNNTKSVVSSTVTATEKRDSHNSQASNNSFSTYAEYVPSQTQQNMGQIFTFIGLGRLWHGFLGWDSEKNKDMMVSHRILKVWEMIFESMPTLALQFYILLRSEEAYNLSVMLSMSASAVSVSFTILYVLYGDHHSMTRKQDLNVGLLKLKSARMLEDFGTLKFSHHNVLALTMQGHSPARIDRAWSAVKMSEEHKYMEQDDPEFEDIMQQHLEIIDEEEKENELPTLPSMNAPMHNISNIHRIPLQIPSIPSMNAPICMISVTVNGQPQSRPQSNANVQQPTHVQQPAHVQYAYPHPQIAAMPPQQGMIPMNMTAVPMYAQPMTHYASVPNVPMQPRPIFYQPAMTQPSSEPITNHPNEPIKTDSEPISIQLAAGSPTVITPNKDDTESDFGGAASTVAMSDISYKEKRNRVNWTHPYIIHLKDLGWSKTQIQSAYFILKNNTDDEESKARSTLKEDDDRFLAFMINILVEELKYKPENPQRQFSDTSECIDKMYQNFVCCLCCRICTKITDETNVCCCVCRKKVKRGRSGKKQDFTIKDNVFYFGMYVFVMTDFYCRIFPLLAYTVLLNMYFEENNLTPYRIANVFIGATPIGLLIGAFELLSYYLMLHKSYKSLKTAIKYFWTGTYTVSYYLLSTMHLTYLPSNVSYIKLYKAHFVRMMVQFVIMLVAIGMQYMIFEDPLGFFYLSIFLFGACWIVNLLILLSMKCYMSTFVTKIDAL